MKCGEIKRLLNLFSEGQLSQEQSLKVKAHLDICEDCSAEAIFLKDSWDLLNEYKPAVASLNFKANFWKRLAQEEASFEKKKVFSFPWLKPRLIPVFTAVAAILICSTYVMNFFSDKGIRNFALAINDKDISMLKNLDLTEDLDIIENIPVLEELKAMDSVEL